MTTPIFERPLTSNGYLLSSTPQRLGWLHPTDPNQSITLLRKIYQDQDYLWLKGFLDREEALSLRRHYLQAFQEVGMLSKESDLVDGIYAGNDAEDSRQQTVRKLLDEITYLPRFQAFFTAPHLTTFLEEFFEKKPRLHERKVLRFSLPGEQRCTDAHYDQGFASYIGTDKFCTLWLPIGDVAVEMGGLTYLEGTGAIGRRYEKISKTMRSTMPKEEQENKLKRRLVWVNLPELADKYDTRWLIANYEAGDVVMHSPYITHAAIANTDVKKRIRLSVDIRYIYE